jgi:hypothetical protein
LLVAVGAVVGGTAVAVGLGIGVGAAVVGTDVGGTVLVAGTGVAVVFAIVVAAGDDVAGGISVETLLLVHARSALTSVISKANVRLVKNMIAPSVEAHTSTVCTSGWFNSRLLAPFSHREFMACVNLHMIERVKAFVHAWPFQPMVCAGDCSVGHDLPSGALAIAFHLVAHIRLKVVPDNAEACGFGGFNIAGAIGTRHVRVIYDESLFGCNARVDSPRFKTMYTTHGSHFTHGWSTR